MLTERSRVSLYERTTNKEVSFMARQNPLELLSSGKALWNTWRRDHPDVQAVEPDLHGADLHGADLRGMDLHGADLDGAILGKAKLDKTNLSRVDLSGADLSKADLRGADLDGAILGKTILDEAHISKADLSEADRNTRLKAKERRPGSTTIQDGHAA